MTTEKNQPNTRESASIAVKTLLEGDPVDIDSAAVGEWAETIEQLQNARDQGGVDAVRQMFTTLSKHNPDLVTLAAGDLKHQRQTHWTPESLYNTDFPDPEFIIPEILPTGLVALGGKAKTGKSWMALQIAHAVSTGGQTLGQKTKPGRVLYLALEDNGRRLKDRQTKQRIPSDAAIDYFTEWGAITTDQGRTALQLQIKTGGYRLVIIDTLSRAIGGQADQLDPGEMTILFALLQRLAEETQTCVLLIDHHTKGAIYQDPVTDLWGSVAKGAQLDAAMGLYRERGKRGATLKITGRDIDENDLAVEFDSGLFCWQCLGDAAEVARDTVQGEIVQTITDLGGESYVSELSEQLGKDKSLISREVKELVNKGFLGYGARKGRSVPILLTEYGRSKERD